jgi:hypothetical protein
MLEEILQECSYNEGLPVGLISRTVKRFGAFIEWNIFGYPDNDRSDKVTLKFVKMFDTKGQGMNDNALYWGLLYLEFTKYAYLEQGDDGLCQN